MEIGELSLAGDSEQTNVAPEPDLMLTRPAHHTLWPLLHEPEQAAFLTQALAQGAALWPATGATPVTHGGLANPAGDRAETAGTQVRVHERGLVVQGRVIRTATGVKVQVLDATGAAIPLKTSATATTTNTHLDATFAASETGPRNFEAVVFFDDPSARFGPVQVRAESLGVTPAVHATVDVLLVGVQIALVDDRSNGSDGKTRGPIQTEADERIVVDFDQSPQSTVQQISAQTRARRMIVYGISHRLRPPTLPEMPLWMAELQLVGIDGASLAAFLRRRATDSGRLDLQLAASWSLQTSWDGPNSRSTTRPYSYNHTWTANTSAQVTAQAAGTQLNGVNTSGAVTNALTPAPTAPPFPVTDRRVAQVVVTGVTRRWGRRSSTAERPAVIVEHQPRLVDAAGGEIIRGGDGELSLASLRIDGEDVDPGRIATDAGTAAPPPATPPAMLPTFRIKGENPPEDQRRPLIDALVEDYVQAHAADAWVAMLRLATWQDTMWSVLEHESIDGCHFEFRGAGRRRYAGQYFGHEQDMPIFGAPAGYGWGQLDNPRVTDDQAWSFAENARAAIRLLIGAKARAAYNLMSPNLANPVTDRERAVLQRETVRRYNGGSEFQWNGTDWEINPSLAQRDSSGNPNPRLRYPNTILNTTVQYWTGQGPTATFPWPIAFPAAQYGPGL